MNQTDGGRLRLPGFGVLRAVSWGASLVLVAVLARELRLEEFSLSQRSIALLGMVSLLSDLGLTLETTRAVVRGRDRQVAQVLGLRAHLVVAGGLVALVVGVAFSGWRGFAYVLVLLPLGWSVLARNHVIAQVRAASGVDFEMTTLPMCNLVESGVAVAAVLVTHSGVTALLSLSIASCVCTVMVHRLARRRLLDSRVRWQIARPAGQWGLVKAGPSMLLVGSISKLALIGATAAADSGGRQLVSALWLVAALRVADALYNFLAAYLVVPVFLESARIGGRSTRVVSSRFAVAIGVSVVLGGALIAPEGFGRSEVAAGAVIAVAAVLWIETSRVAHDLYANGHAAGTSLALGMLVVTAPALAPTVLWPSAVVVLVAIGFSSAMALLSVTLVARATGQPVRRGS